MFTSSVSILLLINVVLGSAIPSNPRPKAPPTAHSFCDNFDNEAVVIVGPQTAIGNTAGGALSYNAFDYTDLVYPLLSNIEPASGLNVAGTGVGVQAQQGQPQWYPINNTYSCFSENSIAYACAVNAEDDHEATSCTIQLAGVKASDGSTVVQDLVYNPAFLAPNQMNVTNFPTSFAGLESVTVTLAQSTVPATTVSIFFDNHYYTAFTGGCPSS